MRNKPSNYNSAITYAPTPNGDIEMNKLVLDHNSYTPGKSPGSGEKSPLPRGEGAKNNKELRVYYRQETHFTRWTRLEMYLMLLCLTLLGASLLTLMYALSKDSKGEYFLNCFFFVH